MKYGNLQFLYLIKRRRGFYLRRISVQSKEGKELAGVTDGEVDVVVDEVLEQAGVALLEVADVAVVVERDAQALGGRLALGAAQFYVYGKDCLSSLRGLFPKDARLYVNPVHSRLHFPMLLLNSVAALSLKL